MQIKLSEAQEKYFAGQSPEQVSASLDALIKLDAEAKNAPKNIVMIEDFTALRDKVNSLVASIDVKLGEATKGFDAKITAIEGKLTETASTAKAEASKVVSEAIAKTGLQAPLGGGSSDGDASAKAFPDIVKAKAEKMPKAEAVTAAIKENPQAYEAWRKAGCTPAI